MGVRFLTTASVHAACSAGSVPGIAGLHSAAAAGEIRVDLANSVQNVAVKDVIVGRHAKDPAGWHQHNEVMGTGVKPRFGSWRQDDRRLFQKDV